MRLWLLVIACALAAQADARPGKVIRIERKGRRFTGEPRWCGVMIDSMQAYCYGKAPILGNTLTVLDMTHTVGAYVIDKVDPLGACKGTNNSLWTVHLKGDVPVRPSESEIAGLLDITVDPRTAHLVKVEESLGSQPATEQVNGFDLDGDNRADLAVTAFICDENSQPITALSNGTTPDQCVQMWVANGHGFDKLRTDRIAHTCY